MKKRAMSAGEKRGKRERILKAAAALLARHPLEDISMDQIARRAGVAKGTLYIYFATREELFLEIHRQDYEAWFKEFAADLRTCPDEMDAAVLARRVTEALRQAERFVQLLAVVSVLLEKNVSFESALAFKSTVRAGVLEAAPELARVLNLSRLEEAFVILFHFHGLVTGLRVHTSPTKIVQRVFDSSAEFDLFRGDFYVILEDGLRRIFARA